MRRVLITGGSGLLGCALVNIFSKENIVLSTYHTKMLHENTIYLDITDVRLVNKIINHFSPELVIHTVAEKNVELCELYPDVAYRINRDGTKNIVNAAENIGSYMVYISTNYIFDGLKGKYAEDDDPNPLNVYGKSKLAGEKAVKEICSKYLIVRTDLLYGWHPNKINFSMWLINELRSGNKVNAICDYFNNPTLNNNLAELINEAVSKKLVGIYNITGGERASRYEFSKCLARIFKLPITLINPITGDQLPQWRVNRPRDPTLSMKKAKKKLNTPFFDLKSGLSMMATLEYANS